MKGHPLQARHQFRLPKEVSPELNLEGLVGPKAFLQRKQAVGRQDGMCLLIAEEPEVTPAMRDYRP